MDFELSVVLTGMFVLYETVWLTFVFVLYETVWFTIIHAWICGYKHLKIKIYVIHFSFYHNFYFIIIYGMYRQHSFCCLDWQGIYNISIIQNKKFEFFEGFWLARATYIVPALAFTSYPCLLHLHSHANLVPTLF